MIAAYTYKYTYIEVYVFNLRSVVGTNSHPNPSVAAHTHHLTRQLVELLEVPQLMDACVRSDLMEEALSIATFASTLERRHRSRRAVPVASPRCEKLRWLGGWRWMTGELS